MVIRFLTNASNKRTYFGEYSKKSVNNEKNILLNNFSKFRVLDFI